MEEVKFLDHELGRVLTDLPEKGTSGWYQDRDGVRRDVSLPSYDLIRYV